MVSGSSGLPCLILFTRWRSPLHELVVDRSLDQRARRAGADLALVEGEHGEAFERLVEEVVVLGHDVGEEDVGRLAAQLQRDRDEVLGRVLHDQPAGRGLAGERDLGDALVLGQRLAGLDAEAVDDVEHARRQQVADQLHQHHDAHRRLLGRLEHDAVAGGERRRELPRRHQQREVPRDDLADDAERLVEVVGDGVVVDLGERAFLGADAAGEIAEVVDRERQVGEPSSRGSACRCRASRPSPASRRFSSMRSAILLRIAARSAGEVLPQASLAACAASSASSMSSAVRAGDLAQRLAGDRRQVVEILPAHRRHPFAADEVVVARPQGHARFQGIDDLVQHGILS